MTQLLTQVQCVGPLSGLLDCPDQFEQELILVLVDKLVLALIVLAAGMLAKFLFEAYQQKQNYRHERALRRLTCISDLHHRLLSLDHLDVELWRHFQKLRTLIEQARYAPDDEAKRLRNKGIEHCNEVVNPLNAKVSELRSEFGDKIREYNFWIEDELLDKFVEILQRKSEVAKIALEAIGTDDFSRLPEGIDQANELQATLEPLIRDVKRAAKQRLY